MALQHITHLAREHEVHLVSFDSRDRPREPGPIEKACASVTIVPQSQWARVLGVVSGLARARPAAVGLHGSSGMRNTLMQVARSHQFDVAVFVMTRTAQYRPLVGGDVPAVLNLVDPMSISLRRSRPWRSWFLRAGVQLEANLTERYEKSIASGFGAYLLAADRDVTDYKAIVPGVPIRRVSHAVDVDHFRNPHSRRESETVVITGNMFYGPNVAGVDWFCRAVWPLVRLRYPEARLLLVGARPAKSVQKWNGQGGVSVRGSVPDIRPYLWSAAVSVCPVPLDVGVQTKVLEAMASGTPVVSTSAGNSGIGGKPGLHLLVADKPSDMAAAIGKVFDGGGVSLASEATRFVEREFTWGRSSHQLNSILLEILPSRARAQPQTNNEMFSLSES